MFLKSQIVVIVVIMIGEFQNLTIEIEKLKVLILQIAQVIRLIEYKKKQISVMLFVPIVIILEQLNREDIINLFNFNLGVGKLVFRYIWDVETAGSSPATQTERLLLIHRSVKGTTPAQNQKIAIMVFNGQHRGLPSPQFRFESE